MRYTLKRAAELADASYTGKSHKFIGFQWKDSLKYKDVEAIILTDNTLLIPGSNSVMDYVRYNLRVQRIGGPRLRMASKGVSGGKARWHQGFMAHAKIVQDWILDNRYSPRFIIGHSLGAASAQILSSGWNIPAIAFAAPRPCRKKDARAMSSKCLCVNRTDDRVCRLPSSFFHLGNVEECTPNAPSPGMDHSMPHYIASVAHGLEHSTLPSVWPKR